MHLTAPLHWSRSIGTNGRDPSELVVTIAGMRRLCGGGGAAGERAASGATSSKAVPSRAGLVVDRVAGDGAKRFLRYWLTDQR